MMSFGTNRENKNAPDWKAALKPKWSGIDSLFIYYLKLYSLYICPNHSPGYFSTSFHLINYIQSLITYNNYRELLRKEFVD